MTIDMNRLTAIRDEALGGGAQAPTYTPPAPAPKPYEGRTFSQLALMDVPRWNTALKLSIARGDMDEAKKYRDMIEETAVDLKDDWLGFAQFKGNNPLGAQLREVSTVLLGGGFGDAVYGEALKDEAVQKRSTIAAFGGPGLLSDLAWKARDPGADPAEAAESQVILSYANVPTSHLSAQTVDMQDPQTGEVRRVRQPVGKLDPATAGDAQFNAQYIMDAKTRLQADPDFYKALGGVDGVAKTAMALSVAGDKDDARKPLFNLAVSSVQDITDPVAKAQAFKSTADMLSRITSHVNPGRDPSLAPMVTAAITATRDAIGPNGFSLKEPLVLGAVQKAVGMALETANMIGQVIPDTRVKTIASAYAKVNSRTGIAMTGEEQEILDNEAMFNRFSAGLAVGDNPTVPIPQGQKAPMTMPDGTVKATEADRAATMGHFVAKSAMERDLDRARAVIRATPGASLADTLSAPGAMANLSSFLMTNAVGTTDKKESMTRADADLAATLVAQAWSRQNGEFDVNNMHQELSKYKDLREAVREDAVSVASDQKQSVAAFNELRSHVAKRNGTASPTGTVDDNAVLAFQALEVGKTDFMPGSGEYNQAVEMFNKGVISPMVNRLTGKGSPGSSQALTTLFSMRASDLDDPKELKKAEDAFIAQAYASGTGITADAIGRGNLERMAAAYVRNNVGLIKGKLGDGYKDLRLTVRDAVGKDASTWNPTRVATRRSRGLSEFSDTVLSSPEVRGTSGAFNPLQPGSLYIGTPKAAQKAQITEEEKDYAEEATFDFMNNMLSKGGGTGLKDAPIITEKLLPYVLGGVPVEAEIATKVGANAALVKQFGKITGDEVLEGIATLPKPGEIPGAPLANNMDETVRLLKGVAARAADAAPDTAIGLAAAAEGAEASADLMTLAPAMASADEFAKAGSAIVYAKHQLSLYSAAKGLASAGAIASKAVQALTAAGLVGTVVWDALQKAQIPEDDTNVAARLKAAALLHYGSVATSTPSPQPTTAQGSEVSPITGRPAVPSTDEPELGMGPDIPKGDIYKAMRGIGRVDVFLDRPITDGVVRNFFQNNLLDENYAARKWGLKTADARSRLTSFAMDEYNKGVGATKVMRLVDAQAAKLRVSEAKYLAKMEAYRAGLRKQATQPDEGFSGDQVGSTEFPAFDE